MNAMRKELKPISIENRQAKFDYEILEKFEAGLALLGGEVKAIQNGRMNLTGAIIRFDKGKLALMNADIPPYQPGNTSKDYDQKRSRLLLLKKSEMVKIADYLSQKTLTILPISVYNKGNLIKLELGVGKKRKKSDKREVIKTRETKREINRSMR
jgi:SsrA-binding protein